MGIADSKFLATRIMRNLLLANADIVSLIGDQIFPVVAPKDTVGDFIIYKREKYSKEYTQMGICKESCEVYILMVSDDYDRSVDGIVLINNLLEGEHDGLTIKLIDSQEDYENSEAYGGKFIQEILFSIE